MLCWVSLAGGKLSGKNLNCSSRSPVGRSSPTGPLQDKTMATVVDPTATASERAQRRSALGQLPLISILGALAYVQLVFRTDRDGLSWTFLAIFVLFTALGGAQIVGDFRAISAWRHVWTEPGEALVWGTSAQRILPNGGGGYAGIFALSSTRLRYIPRTSARIRGASPAEWSLDRLGTVSVEPNRQQKRIRSSRWVVLSVEREAPITLLNNHQDVLADDLHTALLQAKQQRRPTG